MSAYMKQQQLKLTQSNHVKECKKQRHAKQ